MSLQRKGFSFEKAGIGWFRAYAFFFLFVILGRQTIDVCMAYIQTRHKHLHMEELGTK